MITEARHQKIMERLRQQKAVKVTDLVTQLNSSESTIRRDLVQLEQLNYLKRVHGGAVLVQSKVIEKSFTDKRRQNSGQKEQIAKYAASLVQAGDSIYLDSGTSVYEMIKYLDKGNIIVVTNGLSHVETLIEHDIPCLLLGGKVKPKTRAIVGYEALQTLKRYRFDKCFMGTNGVHLSYGFTTPDPEEANIKEQAITAANEAFILADHSKFGEVSFTRFADLDSVQIITNLSENLAEYMEKTKVKVVAQ